LPSWFAKLLEANFSCFAKITWMPSWFAKLLELLLLHGQCGNAASGFLVNRNPLPWNRPLPPQAEGAASPLPGAATGDGRRAVDANPLASSACPLLLLHVARGPKVARVRRSPAVGRSSDVGGEPQRRRAPRAPADAGAPVDGREVTEGA
jgi:hypothetical protein